MIKLKSIIVKNMVHSIAIVNSLTLLDQGVISPNQIVDAVIVIKYCWLMNRSSFSSHLRQVK